MHLTNNLVTFINQGNKPKVPLISTLITWRKAQSKLSRRKLAVSQNLMQETRGCGMKVSGSCSMKIYSMLTAMTTQY